VAVRKPEKVNGVSVYVGFGSPAAPEWSAPSPGVAIIDTGHWWPVSFRPSLVPERRELVKIMERIGEDHRDCQL
jgi:hypothetical protein